MATDVSIAVSIRDNFSQAITTMRNANQAFDKDLDGTMQKLDTLNKNRYELKIDTKKAADELKEAEKQFEKTGSAADKMARDTAAANYDNAKRNLNLVSRNARQAEKNILSMTGAVDKAGEHMSRPVQTQGILSKLAGAGLGRMVGASAQNAANVIATSALGSESGNMFSNILGSTISGAAIGNMIPGGAGAIIGAGVGAATGIVNGYIKNFQKQDEYFKSAVQDSYNTLKQEEENTLQSGIAVAGQREEDQIAFSTLLKGSKEAKSFLSSLVDFGARTPFEYDQLTQISRTLLAYGYKEKEILPLLTKIGDTASSHGWSASETDQVAQILGYMKSSPKVDARMMKEFLMRGVDAYSYLAKASGKSRDNIVEMVHKGLIPGETAAKVIADYMGKANKGGMELQSKTYEGLKSTLEDEEKELQNTMGQAYENTRKPFMQQKIQFYNGSTGSALKEAYAQEGKFKGYLENSKEELEQNILSDVVSGNINGRFSDDEKTNGLVKQRVKQLSDDYKKQSKLAAKGDERAARQQATDIEEAKVLAANAYKNSKGYQLELQGDLSLISNIQSDTALNSEYWNTGKRMGEQFSKGFASTAIPGARATISSIASMTVAAQKTPVISKPSTYLTGSKPSGTSGVRRPASAPNASRYLTGSYGAYATGINRVPYNNFPALLHEGESVRTAVEARSKSAGGVSVEISGPVTVRKESDIDEIAGQIFRKIQKAALVT